MWEAVQIALDRERDICDSVTSRLLVESEYSPLVVDNSDLSLKLFTSTDRIIPRPEPPPPEYPSPAMTVETG